ncbi:type I-E CRISPR-associated protein Cse2/CasB [Lactiplantibacillus paraxiangfangensis]|uniref:type I-E CRISPR-associated protein Cse2/CasB n=1 Tax=Lactiplantibacillus paraxiangfangensis TaxID=3076224 RepID=UPI0030C6ABEF
MTYEIEAATDRIIRTLNRNGGDTRDKAVLSSLNHASSITSQRAQAVWPVLMANLDRSQLSHNGVPTRGEVAVYTAVRLYANYQQGQEAFVYGPSGSSKGKQPEGVQFFVALAKLRQKEGTSKSFGGRVQNVLETTNAASVINGLSHLNKILKGRNGAQKIDFARLAQDLYRLQANYEQAMQVQLLWGQQYFSAQPEADKKEGVQTND